jgi:myosin heavy subunit
VEHHSPNPYLARDRFSPVHFVVQHFAAPVRYEATGFLEKIRDQVSNDMLTTFQDSSDLLLASLMQGTDKTILALQFRHDLIDLTIRLGAKESHYIRCVKTNPAQLPPQFDNRLVQIQVVNMGTMETIRILHEGYEHRRGLSHLLYRYRMLLSQEQLEDSVSHIHQILQQVDAMDRAQIGKDKIFFKI